MTNRTTPEKSRAVLFPTCVVDAIAPDVGMAVVQVLERMGRVVSVVEAATCCGQPAWNAGHSRDAWRVARATLHAMSDVDGDIVVPAGSCASMIRVHWPELFALHGDAAECSRVDSVVGRVSEFSEYVDGGLDISVHTDAPMTYHRSCHMLRDLGISSEPEGLLDLVTSDRRTTSSEGRCCGFGGLFSVKLPEVSVAMADEVLDAFVASGAERVVGCDQSCLLHLSARAGRRGLDLEFSHLAEVVIDRPDGVGDA